jgi:hypothetical protein
MGVPTAIENIIAIADEIHITELRLFRDLAP